jgi:hypothetical protein
MTPRAAPPDEGEGEEPRRFARYEGRRGRPAEDDVDPDDETVFPGLRTLRAWEVAIFLGAIIVSLLIWLIFIWVHRGGPG